VGLPVPDNPPLHPSTGGDLLVRRSAVALTGISYQNHKQQANGKQHDPRTFHWKILLRMMSKKETSVQ